MGHEPRRRGNSMAETAYWDEKPLEALTPAEWESLCDGCGRCCLVKLEDEDTGRIYFTEIACRLLDVTTCRCSDYAHRRRRVRDCLKLTTDLATSLAWLPPTCAYRLRAEGAAPGMVASARLRLAGDSARGGDFRARPRQPDRDRSQDRRLCRAHRQLAGKIAARRAGAAGCRDGGQAARGKAAGRPQIQKIPVALFSLEYRLDFHGPKSLWTKSTRGYSHKYLI